MSDKPILGSVNFGPLLVGNPWCGKCQSHHPTGYDCDAARKRALAVPTNQAAPQRMTPERVEGLRRDFEMGYGFGSVYLKWLFDHIDAQAEEIERHLDGSAKQATQIIELSARAQEAERRLAAAHSALLEFVRLDDEHGLAVKKVGNELVDALNTAKTILTTEAA